MDLSPCLKLEVAFQKSLAFQGRACLKLLTLYLQARDHTFMLRSALLDQQGDGDLLLAAADGADGNVKTHSAFLSCLSPKLFNLLATVSSCSGCRETNVIYFDESSYAALRAILHLIYNGEVNIPLNKVSEAYDLAKVFGLKVFIEQKWSSNSLEENDVSISIEEGFDGTDGRGKEMSLSRFLGPYYKLPKSDPNAVYLPPNAVYFLQCSNAVS